MSSFLFSATEAHICLRCHLRLAAGQARSHRLSRSSPKKSQSRRFAVGQQRLQEHARLDDYDANEQTQFEPPDNFPASGSYEEDDIQLPNDVTQTKAAAADEGFYFRRANLYSRYSLGVTTLGRPAEVLRVHDAPPKDPFERRWWLFQSNDDESPSSTQRLTSSDILDSVALERGLVSAVRAREHIEALKQDWLSGRKEPEQPPSKSECYELGRKLHDGFTIKQLLDYLNEADVPESTELTDLHKPFQSALLTRTEWRAGTTAFPGAAVQIPQSLVTDSRDGPLAKNNYTESTLSYEATRLKEPMKYILVDKIMRRCWNIRPREELESVGEVDFRMPETHLKLLTDYHRDILRPVVEEHGVRIDFSKIKPVSRITANQATCITTLKHLSRVLEDIACHEMHLGAKDGSSSTTTDGRTLLSYPILQEAERLSRTVIRRPKRHGATNSGDETLLIYHLRSDTKSLEDAQRFVTQAMIPTTRAKVTGAFFGGTQAMAKSLIPMPIEVGQGLPMTDRDRSVTWIRKTMTQEKSNHGKNDIHPLPTFRTSQALKSLEHYIKSSNASSEIKLKPADDGFWWLNPHHKTSAVLGRVLYPMKNTTSKKKQGSLLDEMVSHRVFTSDLPNLRRSLETREANMSAKEELYIRLSAAPNPSSGGLESAKLPNLELQFRILIPESTFKRRKAVLKGVRLVLEDKQADLLLPHEQADLRFQHQTYLNSKEDPDPRIMDFVKSSHLDRTDVHHIETPQLLAIEIPRRILFPDQVPKQVDGPNIQIHYSPTSIERRYILQNRPGLNARTRQADLSYATIDAGLIGGRRQEIRFFSDRPGKSDPQLTTDEEGTKVERKSTVKALFKSAIDMIRALRAEAQDGPKPVSKRSLRRMRRVIQGHRGTPLGQKLLRERVRGHMPRAEDSERLRLHPVVRKQWRDVNHRPTDTLRSRF